MRWLFTGFKGRGAATGLYPKAVLTYNILGFSPIILLFPRVVHGHIEYPHALTRARDHHPAYSSAHHALPSGCHICESYLTVQFLILPSVSYNN